VNTFGEIGNRVWATAHNAPHGEIKGVSDLWYRTTMV
jgi:hypothetical protein